MLRHAEKCGKKPCVDSTTPPCVRVNLQDLRNFPSGSIGGERWACYSVCLFVFSHGLSGVCSGPRVQLIPPDFPSGVRGNACHSSRVACGNAPSCMCRFEYMLVERI